MAAMRSLHPKIDKAKLQRAIRFNLTSEIEDALADTILVLLFAYSEEERTEELTNERAHRQVL